MLDFFSFVDGPLVEHRSICVEGLTRNVRCSVCQHQYIIYRTPVDVEKTCICPECGHSFTYTERE